MIRPLLGAVLLFAFAARVCWLDQLPPGFARDEAYYAVDSARVLEVGPRVFYPGNGGREGLFMALAAPFVAIIGRDPLAVRLPAAFAGVIFVAALFAFGRRLFRAQPAGEWVALTAAALAAGSIWLIVENRIGWRLNLFAPLVTVAGYWFWRAYETRRTSDWLAAGAAFGVAQYGYSAVRVLPVVLPGFALIDGLSAPQQLWARRREWIAFAIAAGLIAVPLVLYAVTNPGSFFERQAALAGGDGRLANEDRYVGRLLGTLRMFFLEGAAPAWQSFPGQPVFNPALGALFLIGVALALWRIRRPAYRFILLWLAVFTLAAAIPRDSTPHFIHGAGILPVVFLFPAVGLVETARWFGRLGRSGLPAGRLAATLAGLVVIANLAWAWRLYFDDYRALPGLAAAFDADLVDVANAMNDQQAAAIVIPIGEGYLPGWSHPAIDFLYQGDSPVAFVRVDEDRLAADLAALVGGRREVVVLELGRGRMAPPDNKQIVDFLLRRQGHLLTEEARPGYRIARYALDGPLWPSIAPAGERVGEAEIGALRLADWAAGPSEANDRLWAVARWSLTRPVEEDLKVSLRLRDGAGALVAQADRDLLAAPRFVPTSEWETGTVQSAYFLLDLPPGLPAGRFALFASVYDRESGRPLEAEAALGEVTLPASATPLDPERALPEVTWPGVALVGRALPDRPVRPGEMVSLALFWRRQTGAPADQTEVRFRDGAGAIRGHATAPDAVGPPGALVRQVVELRVSPTAPVGPLAVEVLRDGTAQRIGAIDVVARPRSTAVPAFDHPSGATLGGFATLLGWSARSIGGEVEIELVWQAAATADRDWTVFAHLAGPDGRIVGQHDSPPAGGDAPTASWLPGEVVIDRKRIATPTGPLRLLAGLYDPATGERATGGAIDLGLLP